MAQLLNTTIKKKENTTDNIFSVMDSDNISKLSVNTSGDTTVGGILTVNNTTTLNGNLNVTGIILSTLSTDEFTSGKSVKVFNQSTNEFDIEAILLFSNGSWSLTEKNTKNAIGIENELEIEYLYSTYKYSSTSERWHLLMSGGGGSGRGNTTSVIFDRSLENLSIGFGTYADSLKIDAATTLTSFFENSFKNNGNAKFNGNVSANSLNVTGDASISGTLRVSNGETVVELNGALLKNKLTVNGLTTATSAELKEFTVTGETSATSASLKGLSVTTGTTEVDSADLGTKLTVTGETSATSASLKALTVSSGETKVTKGGSELQGKLTVTGTTEVDSADLGTKLTVTGTTSSTSASLKALTVTTGTTEVDSADLGTKLTVTGTTSSTSASLQAFTVSAGETKVTTGGSELQGKLTVTGTTSATNISLQAFTVSSGETKVTATGAELQGKLTVTGTTSVDGTANLKALKVTSGETEVDSADLGTKLTVTGTTNVTSADDNGIGLSTGTLTVTNVTAANSVNTAKLDVTAGTESQNVSTGALTVTGGVGIGGNLNIGGNSTISGSLSLILNKSPFIGIAKDVYVYIVDTTWDYKWRPAKLLFDESNARWELTGTFTKSTNSNVEKKYGYLHADSSYTTENTFYSSNQNDFNEIRIFYIDTIYVYDSSISSWKSLKKEPIYSTDYTSFLTSRKQTYTVKDDDKLVYINADGDLTEEKLTVGEKIVYNDPRGSEYQQCFPIITRKGTLLAEKHEQHTELLYCMGTIISSNKTISAILFNRVTEEFEPLTKDFFSLIFSS